MQRCRHHAVARQAGRTNASGLAGWIATLAVIALMLAASRFDWQGLRRQEAGVAAERAVPVPAASDAMAMPVDARGCLRPQATAVAPRGEVEAPDTRSWRSAGAGGDRLGVDRCGSVWALWFNSWSVFVDGDPDLVGQVSLPDSGDLGPLSRSGVASFLNRAAGELWVAGRNGDFARYRDGRWERLPAPAQCGGAGFLSEVDAEVWLACGDGGPAMSHWDESTRRWIDGSGTLRRASRYASMPDGTMLAAGEGELAVRLGIPGQAWRHLAQPSAVPTALAADETRIHVGTRDGVLAFDHAGQAQGAALSGLHITGLVVDGHGGVWASAQNEGLHYRDSSGWHAWRYAEGLPDDEGRDLLLDQRGRLWLGGSTVAVIDADAAARRIISLITPKPLPAAIHADACAAARSLLGERGDSGQVVQAQIGDRRLVFFNGEQVCPDPLREPDTATMHWRRDADGAILAVPFNGLRGNRSCNPPCDESQRRTMARFWALTLHEPARTDAGAVLLARSIGGPHPAPDESPQVAAFAGTGEIWLSTRSAGVYQYDGASWRHHARDEGFDRNNPVMALAADRAGQVWVASAPQYLPAQRRYGGAPLHLWNGQHWRVASIGDALRSSSLYALAAGRSGIAAGGNGGVAWLGSEAVENLQPQRRGDRRFVTSIALDANDGLWSAHSVFARGLSIEGDGAVRDLTTRDGLFSNAIRRLAHDGEGRVWLLAEDGRVAVYARQTLVPATLAGPPEQH